MLQNILSKNAFKNVPLSVFFLDFLSNSLGKRYLSFGSNFCVVVNDVVVAEKIQCLHQLVKHAITVKTCGKVKSHCSAVRKSIARAV